MDSQSSDNTSTPQTDGKGYKRPQGKGKGRRKPAARGERRNEKPGNPGAVAEQAAGSRAPEGTSEILGTYRDPEPSAGQIDKIAALLGGDQPEEETTPGAEEQEGGEESSQVAPLEGGEQDEWDEDPLAAEPGDGSDESTEGARALSEVARRLGVTEDEVYSVEVPIGDDETATIGELKDAHVARGEFEQDVEDWNFQKTEQENELLSARMEISALQDLLMEHVPADKLQAQAAQFQKSMSEQLQAHKAALLRMFPKWADSAVMEADRERLRSVAHKYGFRDAEFDMVTDARMVKLLADMDKLVRYVEEKRAKGREARKGLTEKPSRGRQRPKRDDVNIKAGRDPIGAIADLITKG